MRSDPWRAERAEQARRAAEGGSGRRTPTVTSDVVATIPPATCPKVQSRYSGQRPSLHVLR